MNMSLIVDEIWEFTEFNTCWVQNVSVSMTEPSAIDFQINLECMDVPAVPPF